MHLLSISLSNEIERHNEVVASSVLRHTLCVDYFTLVGCGLAEGKLELRDRRTGEPTDVPVEDAVARTVEAIDAKYAELGAKRGEL